MGSNQQTGTVAALETNQQWWDERAPLHAGSDFYSLDAVVDGEQRLGDHEIREVGSVAGKSLIHLQCHLGTETINWARLGAIASGLDFSAETITQAKLLAEKSGVDIDYRQGNVYDAAEVFEGRQFDIAYVNIGSLHWLPDLDRWGKTVGDLLVPGGMLYVNEIHPVASVLGEGSPTFERDYFDGTPVVWNEDGSYADTVDPTSHNEHVIWDRPLQAIFKAVLGGGMHIVDFNERATQEYQQFPYQIQNEDGLWVNPEGLGVFPSTFSLKAIKGVLRES